jgi:2-C-methyl-D-erythritol 4-phosphate cytidylyltransferase
VADFAVILAAAGKSSRFNDQFQKKVFANLASRPLWMHAAEAFSRRNDVAQIIVVIAPEDKQLFNEKFAGNAAMLGIQAVVGGEERADSVLNGLKEVREDIGLVAIHDAARPCIAQTWIDDVFAAARQHGAAILATPCSSTLKRVAEDATITETVDRRGLWLAQTPQVFKKSILTEAYEKHPAPSAATDEASIVEAAGFSVHVVEGSPLNIKVTTKADIRFAELALKSLPKPNPFPFG